MAKSSVKAKTPFLQPHYYWLLVGFLKLHWSYITSISYYIFFIVAIPFNWVCETRVVISCSNKCPPYILQFISVLRSPASVSTCSEWRPTHNYSVNIQSMCTQRVRGQPIILPGINIFPYYSSIIPGCFSIPIIPQIMLA